MTFLRSLRRRGSLVAIASEMFRDIWNDQQTKASAARDAQKKDLRRIEADIRKAADILLRTESDGTSQAIEAKIDQLETQQALLAEDLAKPEQ